MSETTTAAIEAAREALQSFLHEFGDKANSATVRKAREALAALAHQEQRAEPVAWRWRFDEHKRWVLIDKAPMDDPNIEVQCLIVAPQPPKD